MGAVGTAKQGKPVGGGRGRAQSHGAKATKGSEMQEPGCSQLRGVRMGPRGVGGSMAGARQAAARSSQVAQSTCGYRSQGLSGSEVGGWGLEKRQQEKGRREESQSQHLHLLSHTDSTSVKSILPSKASPTAPRKKAKVHTTTCRSSSAGSGRDNPTRPTPLTVLLWQPQALSTPAALRAPLPPLKLCTYHCSALRSPSRVSAQLLHPHPSGLSSEVSSQRCLLCTPASKAAPWQHRGSEVSRPSMFPL